MSRPATLDGQLQERDALRQAVVAPNAGEDASRWTWTQARQSMHECFSEIVDTIQRMLTGHAQVKANVTARAKGGIVDLRRHQEPRSGEGKGSPRTGPLCLMLCRGSQAARLTARSHDTNLFSGQTSCVRFQCGIRFQWKKVLVGETRFHVQYGSSGPSGFRTKSVLAPWNHTRCTSCKTFELHVCKGQSQPCLTKCSRVPLELPHVIVTFFVFLSAPGPFLLQEDVLRTVGSGRGSRTR